MFGTFEKSRDGIFFFFSSLEELFFLLVKWRGLGEKKKKFPENGKPSENVRYG